ncbi:delta-aminolevulinic acid dehydratase [Clostridia bacterium]|nr:delta-aminolevulinic acid dehydratase [Clostridia bacterium]
MEITNRPRRLRAGQAIRKMVRETRVSKEQLVFPLFIKEGRGIRSEISSMPGQYHLSPDMLGDTVESLMDKGVTRFLLFGLPAHKDEIGSGGFDDEGVVQRGIRAIKERRPDAYVITDVCMCEYTSHGHCGILNGGRVDNDATLGYLDKIAVSHGWAGCDMVAPSDMMDGRVGSLRRALDSAGFSDIGLMPYAVKYASSFYGPFRSAADSTPSFGDRKTYQMDYHNSREALREALLDVSEGADILIVKPALAYLDIVSRVRDICLLPVAAYSVSGEYSMIKASAAAGLVDEYGVMCETAVAALRAGADILITYFAPELAGAMDRGDI